MHDILLDFAIQTNKKSPEEYVSTGGWKARQGGNGLEHSKNAVVEFKPCALDESSINFELSFKLIIQHYSAVLFDKHSRKPADHSIHLFAAHWQSIFSDMQFLSVYSLSNLICHHSSVSRCDHVDYSLFNFHSIAF